MRLAVYHNLPSGGALRAACELSARLASGHDVDLYLLSGTGAAAIEDHAALAQQGPLERVAHGVYRYPVSSDAPRSSASFLRYLPRLLAAQRRVADDIDSRGYDAAFVHPCAVTQTPGLLSMLRTPTAYYMQEPRRTSFEHGLRSHPEPNGRLPLLRSAARGFVERRVRSIDEQAAKAPGLILANSYFSIESIYRSYGRDAVFCPLGVDGELFSISTPAPRQHRVLSVGALVPHKGHEFVIRSAGVVKASARPKVGIACNRGLAGFERHLALVAEECAVELEIHHAVSDERLVELYQTSGATVCAARLEPFGLTALESLACGTPVIAVREGGFREVVTDGVNGVLIDRDAGDGAAAIQRLLGNSNEVRPGPDELRASALPAWSWDRATQRLDSLLRKFVREQPGYGHGGS